MSVISERTRWFAANGLFPSLFLGVFGVAEGTSERRGSFDTAAFPWYLLLFAAGVLVALSTISAVLLGLVALLTYAVPWAKIPVCRARFIVSSIVMLAGAIGSLAVHGKPVHPCTISSRHGWFRSCR